MVKVHTPTHPGEILLREFLVPYCITQAELARAIGVSPRRINEIVHGKRAITADTALRLARAFSMNDAFFSGLQADYDIEVERDRLDATLDQIAVLPAMAKELANAN